MKTSGNIIVKIIADGLRNVPRKLARIIANMARAWLYFFSDIRREDNGLPVVKFVHRIGAAVNLKFGINITDIGTNRFNT